MKTATGIFLILVLSLVLHSAASAQGKISFAKLTAFAGEDTSSFPSLLPVFPRHTIDKRSAAFLNIEFINLSLSGTTYTWTGSVSTDWFTPQNWIPNGVPNSDDTATINNNTTVQLSSNTAVANLNFGAGTLTGSGKLTVTGIATVTGEPSVFNAEAAVSSLSLPGGTLAGSGTVTVTGTLNWSRGAMAGSGKTVIAQGAIANAYDPTGGGGFGSLTDSRLLDNAGTLNVVGGLAIYSGSAVINNSGTLDLPGSGFIYFGTLNNTGTIIKSAGEGQAELQVRLNNNGTVKVQSGTLLLNGEGGVSGGSFTVDSGATLHIRQRSDYALTNTSSISGAGSVIFSSGIGTIDGTYNVTGVTTISGGEPRFNLGTTIPTLNFTGGSLAGSGTVAVTGTLNWSRGAMAGSGKTVIAQGATANTTGTGPFQHGLSRTLDNAGTFNYAGNGFGGSGPPWTINNSGTFDIQADSPVASGTFNNTGTLVKSGGTGLSRFEFTRLNNSGVVEVKTGRVVLPQFDYVQTAGTTILNGGDFGAPNVVINGGSLIGFGGVLGNLVNSGTVSPGLTSGSAGVLNVSGKYTQTPIGTLDIELGGSIPGTEFDQLIIGTGTLEEGTAFDGILNVILVNGFTPPVDSSFQISRFNKREGKFDTINGLDLGGRSLDATFSDFDLVLKSGSGAVGEAQPWVDIIGPDAVRVRAQPHNFTFTLTFGNSGGADAVVPVAIILPATTTGIEVEGIMKFNPVTGVNEDFANDAIMLRDENLTLEEAQTFRDMPRAYDTIESGSNARMQKQSGQTLLGAAGQSEQVVPIVTYIAAGLRHEMKFRFTLRCDPGSTKKPRVKVGTPMLVNDAVNCVEALFKSGLDFVPGLDCLKFGYSAANNLMKVIATGKPAVSGAAFWFKTIRSAAGCATSLVPALKAIKIAVDMTRAVSQGIGLFGTFQKCGKLASHLLFGAERTKLTGCVASADPNDKVGSDGVGAKRFINGTEPLKYLITFENKPEATAPAQVVTITDQLDVTKVDLNSFYLGSFAFGDRKITAPQAASAFITDVDLRPDKNLIVRINAKLDKTMGIVTWHFTALDPATGELPANPLVGFLPPDQNPPEGQGSVFFTVMPKADLPSGTEIQNRATIVFDQNDPIDTGDWSNTIDNTKPASLAFPLPPQSPPSFEVRWEGSDAESGIQNFTIFVSEDGGPYTDWLANTQATSATFTGEADKSYSFYSVARDGAGHLEEAPIANGVIVPDATTKVSTAATPTPTPTPTPTATPTPTSLTIQLSASSYTVGEGDQRVNITITRSGDTTNASSVRLATGDAAGSQACKVLNGAASSRCDYEILIQTVQFGAGETAKAVPVFIIDDSYLEGIETFSVNLSNPSGASLSSPSTATISISDNDIADGSNPIDSPSFFVRQHYLDFLNREPDSSGLAFWTNQITECGTNAACTDIRRTNVSAAFYLSIEFQETGYLVYRFYKASYGNLPGAPVPVRFGEFLTDTQQIGKGVIVGQGNWQAQLETNKVAFAADFVGRSRLTSAHPTTMSPAAFVDALFGNAGVTPSATDRNAAINEFGGAGNTSDTAARARALRLVADNEALKTQEFNRAFVLMQYFGYLRRNPDDPQDTDFTGYDFWLTKLNQFNGNFIHAEMVKAFIVSIEYRSRFGP